MTYFTFHICSLLSHVCPSFFWVMIFNTCSSVGWYSRITVFEIARWLEDMKSGRALGRRDRKDSCCINDHPTEFQSLEVLVFKVYIHYIHYHIIYIYIFKFIFIFKAFLTHPRLKNPRHDRGGCGQSFVPAFLPGWELLVSHFSPAMKIWMLVPKYGDISRFIWMLVPKSYGDIMRYLH